MNIKKLLTESLQLLVKHPTVIIPRLITTIIHTAIQLLLVKTAVDLTSLTADPEILAPLLKQTLILGVLSLTSLIIDATTYAIYPLITRNLLQKGKPLLKQAARETLTKGRAILFYVILTLTIATVIGGTAGILTAAHQINQNKTLLLAAAIITLTGLYTTSISLYHLMPLLTLENQGIKQTLQKSLKLSRKQIKPLTKLNTIYLTLILTPLTILYTTKLQGNTTIPALTLYLLIRAIQTLTYTYITINNPLTTIKTKNEV
jgi:hypothetical protein